MNSKRSLSRQDGQGAVEYVLLLAVVAILLALMFVPISGGRSIGERLIGAIKHGMCLASMGVCSNKEAKDAGLTPCVMQTQSSSESAGVKAWVVKLGHGAGMLVERRSDGSASVTFSKEWEAGVEVGLGYNATVSKADLKAGGGLRFTAGEVFDFPTVEAATRFTDRFQGDQTLLGEAKGWGRKLCPGFVCRERMKGSKMPPASARYLQGGVINEAAATLNPSAFGTSGAGKVVSSGVLDGKATLSTSHVLGRRVRGPRTTWYVKLDGDITGNLGTVLGAARGGGSSQVVAEYTAENGVPAELKLKTFGRVSGDISLSPTDALRVVGQKIGKAIPTRPSKKDRAQTGRAMEASVTLNLKDEANRKAVGGLIDVMRLKAPPKEALNRIKDLGTQIDHGGVFDVRVFKTNSSAKDVGAEVAVGAKVGVNYGKKREVRELEGAWSRIQGGPLKRREDCEPA